MGEDVRLRWPIRGLTRGEMKRLRADGIQLASIGAAQVDDAIDRVIGMVLSDQDVAILDDAPNAEAMAVFEAIIAETYGYVGEEKNFPKPGTAGSAGQTAAFVAPRVPRR